MRHRISPGVLAAAELRSAEIGTGADRTLVAAGAITDDDYARALAHTLGVVFDSLERAVRADAPSLDLVIQAARTGMLPLRTADGDVLVIAPQAYAARHVTKFIANHPEYSNRIRLTTRSCIERFIRLHAPVALAQNAAYSLRDTQPEFSAAHRARRGWLIPAGIACLLAALVFPSNAALAFEVLIAFIFLGWIALRLLGALTTGMMPKPKIRPGEDRLPVYTVIVALYREAATFPDLVRSLAALDYPHEKLEIKLVVEPDDPDMHAAVRATDLDRRFEVIVAPAIGPRTKPKALNAALPFSRGSFIAVYDAEDRPEPDQLRRALQAFESGSDDLGCVQARLTIDNCSDSVLTRLYTAEYSGLFDVFLPGIAMWRLPLPLEGSSNHFRDSALRHVGAWDPYNVTEDADLGMRLSRFGYRTAMIDSATYEEAPSRVGPWLKQRTRWFKGWMQTWLVHMRHPFSLLRDLGFAGFVVFQLVVGGTVLAALVHSLFAAAFMWEIVSQGWGSGRADLGEILIAGLHGTTLISGYAISVALGVIGLARRRLLHCAWALLATPIYWVLLSVAAWRALIQLLHDPYRWEKTEHGRARTSRLASMSQSRTASVPPRF